jgi:hypothetical protein
MISIVAYCMNQSFRVCFSIPVVLNPVSCGVMVPSKWFLRIADALVSRISRQSLPITKHNTQHNTQHTTHNKPTNQKTKKPKEQITFIACKLQRPQTAEFPGSST